MKKENKTTSKKSLQKLTDIENLNTTEKLTQYLTKNPNDWRMVMDNLQERINDTYLNKKGKEYEIENLVVACHQFKNIADAETDVRNTTYEVNHSLITNCLHNYIIEHRNFPAMQTIASETGLSRTTIYKHLSDGVGNKYNRLVLGKLEYMTSSALASLYHIGINDRNATALKNFIELAGKMKTSTSTINNFIQINNLKLSNEEFNQLPEDVILEVEQLISKSLIKN